MLQSRLTPHADPIHVCLDLSVSVIVIKQKASHVLNITWNGFRYQTPANLTCSIWEQGPADAPGYESCLASISFSQGMF